MGNEIEDLITLDELCEILNIGRNAAYSLLNSHEMNIPVLVSVLSGG